MMMMTIIIMTTTQRVILCYTKINVSRETEVHMYTLAFSHINP